MEATQALPSERALSAVEFEQMNARLPFLMLRVVLDSVNQSHYVTRPHVKIAVDTLRRACDEFDARERS